MHFKRKAAILTIYLVVILLTLCTGRANTNETVYAQEYTVSKEERCSIAKGLSPMLENLFESKNDSVNLKDIELEEAIEESEVNTEPTETIPVTTDSEPEYKWQGEVLNAWVGTIEGPSGKETYYNLDMSGIISMMQDLGYDYEYHIREDGVKMFGPYVMCAANLDLHPRGTIVETSLGLAMVCDTGGFAEHNPTQIDIATNW